MQHICIHYSSWHQRNFYNYQKKKEVEKCSQNVTYPVTHAYSKIQKVRRRRHEEFLLGDDEHGKEEQEEEWFIHKLDIK